MESYSVTTRLYCCSKFILHFVFRSHLATVLLDLQRKDILVGQITTTFMNVPKLLPKHRKAECVEDDGNKQDRSRGETQKEKKALYLPLV